MNKYIFLDRDGTLNIEKNYLHKFEELEYEESVINSLLKLKNMGYKFIILTNQSGIARGYFTIDDYFEFERLFLEDLNKYDIYIEKIYYCPHHTKGINEYAVNCECRKPKTGMFLQALSDFDVNVNESYMIGDKVSDLLPAEKLGFKTVLLTTGHGKTELTKLNALRNSVIVSNTLGKFVDFLL